MSLATIYLYLFVKTSNFYFYNYLMGFHLFLVSNLVNVLSLGEYNDILQGLNKYDVY